MSNNANDGAKLRWLGRTMDGENAEIRRLLVESLPTAEVLDAEGEKQLAICRGYMAELWLRGVSQTEFVIESGITGFEIDPVIEGLGRQDTHGDHKPTYFRLFLTELDPKAAATAMKTLMLSRMQSMPEEYRDQFQMLFFIDIDTESKEYPYPYQAGITPRAICFDCGMPDIESMFERVDAACRELSPHAQRKLRFGIGRFGPDEYKFMGYGNIFTKRMVFDMGAEWLMVQNIRRRAGRFGWYWRLLAKYRDRKD